MSESFTRAAEGPALAATPAFFQRRLLLAVALFILAVIPFLPALHGQYTWDDDQWLVNNAPVHAWNGLKIIWNPFRQTLQYYPITFTLLWLEHKLWGLDSAGYHAVNMLLHACGAVLLWLSLRRLGLRGAWLAALLWAVHPVQADSVAWVSEIKNTLSGVFFFGAVWSYLKFERIGNERADGERRRWLFYALAFGAFVAAMLSKMVACTLPGGLLIVLWWKRERLSWKTIWPLLPLFAVSFGISIFAALQERLGIVGGRAASLQFHFFQRVIICGKDVWFYVRTLIMPYPLMAIYPRWTYDMRAALNYVPFVGVLAALAGLWLLRRKTGKGPLGGVLFFLVTLSPGLGFINFFTMHYTFVADHYQYLACAGILAIAAELLTRVMAPRAPAKIIVAVVVICLMGATAFYASLFQTDMKLWRWNVARNPNAFAAQENLGVAYVRAGNRTEALRHIRIAVAQQPDDDNIQRTMGQLARDNGQFDEAIAHFQRSIALHPRFGFGYVLLGGVYERMHQPDKALAAYAKAVAVDDTDPANFVDYAAALKKAGQLDNAAAAYRNALLLAPGNMITRYNYGNLLLDLNKPREAIEQYEVVLKYQDENRNGPTWHNLAFAYNQIGDKDRALAAEKRGNEIDAANALRNGPPASQPKN